MNKIQIRYILIFAALLVLIFSAVYWGPKAINSYLNQEHVKARLQDYLDRELNLQVNFQEITFALFPAPHIEILEPGLNFDSRWGEASAAELQIFPHLIPLFKGKWKTDKLLLWKPKWSLPSLSPLGFIHLDPEKRIAKEAESLLKGISFPGKSLSVIIKQGKIHTKSGKYSKLVLKDINMSSLIAQDAFQVDLKGRSNICKQLVLKAEFDLQEKKGSAELSVQKLRARQKVNEYLGDQFLSIKDFTADLQIGLKWSGDQHWQGAMQLKLPVLRFAVAKQEFSYADQFIQLSMNTGLQGVRFKLQESSLFESGLQLDGDLNWEHKNEHLNLQLTGKQGDVSEVRRLCLALAGQQATVQDIFNILKEGRIPGFNIQVQGKGWKAISNFENWLVQGRISKGQIFVPGIRLDLAQTRAQATIKDEVLQVRDIFSAYGQTSIQKGSFDLDMSGKHLKMNLDTGLQANLAQLPDMLKHVLKGSPFSRTLRGVTDISGQARAELSVKGPLSELQVATRVSDFHLRAEHEQIPLPLTISKGQFALNSTAVSVQDISAQLGSSNFSELKGTWKYGLDSMLQMQAAKSKILLEDAYSVAKVFDGLQKEFFTLNALQGNIVFSQWRLQGPADQPLNWDVQAKGGFDKLILSSPHFPGKMSLEKGSFRWKQGTISLEKCLFSFLDVTGQLGVNVATEQQKLSLVSLNLKSAIKEQFQNWFFKKWSLPENLKLQTPARIRAMQLKWKPDALTKVNATIRSPAGTVLKFMFQDAHQKQKQLELALKDNASEALISSNWSNSYFKARFSGEVYQQTLAGLLKENNILQDRIKGKDVQLIFDIKHPMRSRMRGFLRGNGLLLPVKGSKPLVIKKWKLQGTEKRLFIKSVDFEYDNRDYALQGNMKYYDQGGQFDLKLDSSTLNWHYLQAIARKMSPDAEKGSWNLGPLADIQGSLRVLLDSFSYKDYALKPLKCDIVFAKDKGISITLLDSKLCSLDINGTISFAPEGVDLKLKSINKNKELNPVVTCLSKDSSLISAPFDFKAKLKGQGKAETLRDSLQGSFNLQAEDGRIHRWGLLAKVFSTLNVAELFQGKLPDLKDEGFAFNTLKSSGQLAGGNLLTIKRTVLKGPSMTLVLEGEVDILQENLDLQLLLAPLPTVDWFIDKIPIVRHILGGTLVAVPVRVHGNWSDPRVVPLSPASVGSRVVDMLKRTLEVPAKLIQPFVTEEPEEPEEVEKDTF